MGPSSCAFCEDFEQIGPVPGNYLEQRALPQGDSVLRDPGPVPAHVGISHVQTFVLELVVLWVPHKPITSCVAIVGGVAANLNRNKGAGFCLISMAHHVGFIGRKRNHLASVPTVEAPVIVPCAASGDVYVLCRASVASSRNNTPVTVSTHCDDGTAKFVPAVIHGAVPRHGLPGVGTDYVLVGASNSWVPSHAVDPVVALIRNAAASVHGSRVVGNRNPAFLLRPAVNLVVFTPAVVSSDGVCRSSVSNKFKVGATEERLRFYTFSYRCLHYQLGMLAMVCHAGDVELVSSQKQSQPWHKMTQWD